MIEACVVGEVDSIYARLLNEHDHDDSDWEDKEVGNFIWHTYKEKLETPPITGMMCLGHMIVHYTRAQIIELYAKFKVEWTDEMEADYGN